MDACRLAVLIRGVDKERFNPVSKFCSGRLARANDFVDFGAVNGAFGRVLGLGLANHFNRSGNVRQVPLNCGFSLLCLVTFVSVGDEAVKGILDGRGCVDISVRRAGLNRAACRRLNYVTHLINGIGHAGFFGFGL